MNMNRKRILLIDDDDVFCGELAEALGGEGYDVVTTSDPEHGKDLLRDASFDLAILNYKMPVFTGTELLRKLRRPLRRKQVIMLTGRPRMRKLLEEEGLSDLVVGVMTKPVGFPELSSEIEKALAG
jgi:DNA-binding response OmpR family regulator